MAHFIQLAPNIENFYNLAIFVCHLFIDGNFRTGHILYDPNIFDNRLVSEINSVCPRSIPWLTTDITEASLSFWEPQEQTDHILQLIFFNLDHFEKEVDEYKYFLTFYRVFIFPSSDQAKIKSLIVEMRKSELTFSSSSLIVHQISEDNVMCIHWTPPYNGQHTETCDNLRKDRLGPFYLQNRDNLSGVNVFDLTFGKYDQMWLMLVDFVVETFCGNKPRKIVRGSKPAVNYFVLKLKQTFVDLTTINCSEITHKIVHPKSRRFYKEFVNEFMPLNKKETEILKTQRSNTLNIELFPTSLSKRDKNAQKISLYPYRFIELKVLYVYAKGEKLQRRTGFVDCFGSIRYWVYLTWIFSAAVLFAIRRQAKLRRGGFISSALDTFTAFFGGGRLRIHHRLERLFFGVLLIGSFFLTSIWSDASLFQCNFSSYQKIDSFEKLSALNPNVYIGTSIELHAKRIGQMLKEKMGKTVKYSLGIGFSKLLGHRDSFAYVVESLAVDNIKYTFNGLRIIDVLPEKLGIINTALSLKSEQYISKRKMAEVNNATRLMFESGLAEFYMSQYQYILKLETRKMANKRDIEKKNDDIQSLTMEQMITPSLIVLIGLIIACFTCAMEIIIYRLTKRHNNRVRNLRN